MSEQLRALGDEIKSRGSMLKSAAKSFLSRHFGMTDQQSSKQIDIGNGKFYRVEQDALYPASVNPVCACKLRKHAAVAVDPGGAGGSEKSNPVRKAKKASSKSKRKAVKRSGARVPKTISQEEPPMAAKKTKGKGKTKAHKPAAKKATRKAATARQAKSGSKPRRRTAAKASTTNVNVKVGSAPAAKKPTRRRRRRPAKVAAKRVTRRRRRRAVAKPVTVRRRRRRAATKRVAARKPRKTTRRATRHTTARKVRGGVRITQSSSRFFPIGRRNPVSDTKHMVVGILAIGAGYGTFEIIDRMWVSSSPKDSAGKPIKDTNGKDIVRLTGFSSLMMRHTVPDWKRMAIPAGGALAFGVGAYMLRKHTSWGTVILGGVAIGATFKLAGMGINYLLLKIYPVKADTEDTWMNEVFPEINPKFDLNANNTQASAVAAFQSGQMMGLPPWRRSASARNFGPVAGASGNVGKCCKCGASAGGCSCPKAQAPQPDAAQPGTVVQVTTPGSDSTSTMTGTPAYVQGQGSASQLSTRPIISLADKLRGAASTGPSLMSR